MRMAIEVFSLILVITISCIMFSSMISISVQNAQARDYYNIVRNRIEDSNHSADVIEECKKEAEAKGYELEVEDITAYPQMPSKLVRLKYKIVFPIYQVLKIGQNKQALVEGYAR